MENIRQTGMIKICKKLTSDLNIDLSEMRALDFYAREGDWQTSVLSDYVKDIDAWEVGKQFEENLIKNLPDHAKIRIGDSFKLSSEKQYKNKFDIVVFDNPAGCYGEKPYCEHFEALELVPRLIKKEGGIVIFNIKANPFNYDNFPQWKQRRESYYELSDASNLDISDLNDFYKNKFIGMNFDVKFLFVEHRLQQSDLYSFTFVIGGKK